ncbi:MAG: DNA polymerase III subunit alpha [Lachnospiraceae bacterium]|nr:DNA polymerase III subunit alpha [Lachnospiraceae bacterium]
MFAHLHVHTEYSLLDGASKIKEITAKAKELGMDSLAITDHGVMYGVIDFYKACRAIGIRPILGCEVYVAPDSRLIKDSRGDDRYNHLVLLAENNKGYENLVKLVSMGFVDGFYYRPRVDEELLRKYHEGLIALSACLAGEVPRLLNRGLDEEAAKAALKYKDIFGAGNYFLELQDHGIKEQQAVNAGLLRLSKELDIPLAATNDVHYTNADDVEPHDILLCLQTGKKLADEDRMRYEGGQYYLKSEEEMRALFPYAKEALDNTQKIAERCNVEIEFGVTKLPKFDVPEGYDSWTYLNKLCDEGMAKRYPNDDGTLRERLDYELGVIKKMGYVDYFLIVWDFINYAKRNGIAVGPGRGSAAGSVVSYCLEITDIDPIRYQLLFERFLNPERVSMPDIDVDFCFERRQEVIDYVTRKYGSDRVVQIVTFGTMAARGVIRDVGRVMDLPYALCDQVAKMIPAELNMTIDKALEQNPELRSAYKDDDRITKLIDMSKRLEGLPRHTSTHAAGVVISKAPVMEYVPLSRSQEGMLTTQFTMTTLEELGLLKMDFLGLRTLTVIQNCIDLIEQKRGFRLDLHRIDYGDPVVFDALSTGKNDGVFQLESKGMKSFMKELQPRNIEDLIAGIALYRPGPMDFIPLYIRGKTHPGAVTYDTPLLKPILEATYGCIVYQEQVMQIVRDLGGYTLGRSDLVRRAMSKKKNDVMQRERQNFVYGNKEEGVPGCISRGIPESVANKVFDNMTDFAKYAFNKSHAAAYAVVSYQTAYLKQYYPVEFMAALMTSVIDHSETVIQYINVCRSMNIEILPPDINTGFWNFSVEGKKIRYGLSAIKGLGRGVIENIVAEREAHGPFADLDDLIGRLTGKEVNKRTIENLILAGALDSLPGNRRQKMLVYGLLMDEKARQGKEVYAGQMNLFDMMGEEDRAMARITMPQVPEYENKEILQFEKEVIGVYLSGHPMLDVDALWQKYATAGAADFVVDPESGKAEVHDGEIAVVGGIITAKTKKTTKNGQIMAFVTIEDVTGNLEVIIFPRDYDRYKDVLEPDRRVFIRGRVSIGDDPVGKLVCERVQDIDDLPKELWVRFADAAAFEAGRGKLTNILAGHGATVYLEKERKKIAAKQTIPGEVPEDDIYRLKVLFGEENVKLTQKKLDEAWSFK